MRRVAEDDEGRVRAPEYRAYVRRFVEVGCDLRTTMESFGLPIDADDGRVARADALRAQLVRGGALVRNDGKSIVSGPLSPACERCRTGERSVSQFLSLACPRACWFCFNSNQYDYDAYRLSKKDWRAEMDAYAREMGPLDYVALTGGEPLLYPDEACAFFEHAKRLNSSAHCRLYTSGWHADRALFERLAKSGLDEVRFSVKLDGEPACGGAALAGLKSADDSGRPGEPGGRGDEPRERREPVGSPAPVESLEPLELQLARVEEAVGVIPAVMVEMPVVPGTADEMRVVLRELERMGAFGINLLELCFPLHNVSEYACRGLSLVADPYRIPYDYRYAGALPVAGSEELALELMLECQRANMKLGVHYCSLENKNTAQVFAQNHGGAYQVPNYRFSRRDFFYKTLRAFGEDALALASALRKVGAEFDASGEAAAERAASAADEPPRARGAVVRGKVESVREAQPAKCADDLAIAFDPALLGSLPADAVDAVVERGALFCASAVVEPIEGGRERFREVGLAVVEPSDVAAARAAHAEGRAGAWA